MSTRTGPSSEAVDASSVPSSASGLSGDAIWRAVAKASFAVIGYTTPAGEPRSSGVIYTVVDDRMYVAVANDSWKAKHIPETGRVSVTVPVRRGGILSLVAPIPPATISFHASATLRPLADWEADPLLEELKPLLPRERRESCTIVEVRPEGHFVTYGLGVPLLKMRDTALARSRVPVR